MQAPEFVSVLSAHIVRTRRFDARDAHAINYPVLAVRIAHEPYAREITILARETPSGVEFELRNPPRVALLNTDRRVLEWLADAPSRKHAVWARALQLASDSWAYGGHEWTREVFDLALARCEGTKT